MTRSVEDIAEDLAFSGSVPSHEEIYFLCQDAAAGHKAMDTLEALVAALGDAGYKVVDISTDDDDGTRLEIWPLAEGEDYQSYTAPDVPMV